MNQFQEFIQKEKLINLKFQIKKQKKILLFKMYILIQMIFNKYQKKKDIKVLLKKEQPVDVLFILFQI